MINRFDRVRPVSGAFVLITFLVWAWTPGVVLGQSGSGTVSGVVSDATTGNHLPGANVLILGSSRGAATDVDGEYAIRNVPAGSYRLRVSYIGYEPVTREITVDGDTGVDVALSVSQLRTEGVVVLGSRAQGQAKALSQQKNAANITNVVAADQIGQFPDATAPDALQRVPGIGVQRDQGEGRFIQIRGGAPQLTTVTFNG